MGSGAQEVEQHLRMQSSTGSSSSSAPARVMQPSDSAAASSSAAVAPADSQIIDVEDGDAAEVDQTVDEPDVPRGTLPFVRCYCIAATHIARRVLCASPSESAGLTHSMALLT